LKTTDNRKFRVKSFCFLEPDLIESEAVQKLSGKAALFCLVRFHQKAYRKKKTSKKKGMKDMVITNQGEIIFTYAEAEELGIKSPTFFKVIRELVEDKGFIDIAEQGNWYLKQPKKFSISERWRKFGTPDYKLVKIPRILPDGVGFQKKVRE
jgi:hypothetical protein